MPIFDQSTFLAHRATDAQALPDPEPPAHVVLPGARAAVSLARLEAHHALGRDEAAIVSHENAQWRQRSAERLAEHAHWVGGPYRNAIVEMQRAAVEAAAEQQRKQALFEQLIAERDAKGS